MINNQDLTKKKKKCTSAEAGNLTMLSALSVVSSREAAKHPSSVDPPSHIPANAAMLLRITKIKQRLLLE